MLGKITGTSSPQHTFVNLDDSMEAIPCKIGSWSESNEKVPISLTKARF
jgi:hypothetical protein